MAVIVCAMWFLWASGNRLIHDGIAQTSIEVVDKVVAYIGELDALKNRSSANITGAEERWRDTLVSSIIQNKVHTEFAAEALACLKAVRVGLDLKLQEVIIEGDALSEGLKRGRDTYLIGGVPDFAEPQVEEDRRNLY
ncbi:hypothetical protein GOBAR_DD13180 [Gossypium barbadense]|nr:hypothetical protein GOBAR_DD13180 [Gossypium barbadense]